MNRLKLLSLLLALTSSAFGQATFFGGTPQPLATTDSPTFSNLTLATGTITTSRPFNLSQTWNTVGTTYTGILSNVTDTASASGSLLMDLQVGGVSKLSLSKGGVMVVPSISVTNGINAGGSMTNYGMAIYGGSLAFGPTGDTLLSRDAANIFAQRNGTNAQAFRFYNTYTSATNFENLEAGWTSNVAHLWTTKGSGGGTARDLVLGTDSQTQLTLGAAGAVTLAATGTNQNVTLTPSGTGFLLVATTTSSPLTPVFRSTNYRVAGAGDFANTFECLTPNLAAGGVAYASIGVSATTNNRATYGFTYAGSGSANNFMQIGAFYDATGFTALFPSGGVVISASGTPTDPGAANLLVNGQLKLGRTITPAGTTGNVTINKGAGTVNFPSLGLTTYTVTNSLVTTASQIMVAMQATDATATRATVGTKAAGSFTINVNAAATLELPVYWEIRN